MGQRKSTLRQILSEVGPFCRKGLRSPAATCDQMRFHFKLMSPEITTPLFVSPCDIPLTVRLTAVTNNFARQAEPTLLVAITIRALTSRLAVDDRSMDDRSMDDRTMEDRTMEDRTMEDRTMEDRTMKRARCDSNRPDPNRPV